MESNPVLLTIAGPFTAPLECPLFGGKADIASTYRVGWNKTVLGAGAFKAVTMRQLLLSTKVFQLLEPGPVVLLTTAHHGLVPMS